MGRERKAKRSTPLWQRLGLTLLALLLAALVLLRAFAPVSEETPPTPSPEPVQASPSPTEPPTPSPSPSPSAEPEPTAAPPPIEPPADFVPPQGYSRKTYDMVSEMVYAYKEQQADAAQTVQQRLEELEAADPALGKLWREVMAAWDYARSALPIRPGEIPEGLPEDESLALVVLGYQLLDDGSMDRELLARCELALACAERYPSAYVIVTGGGTAKNKKEISEAGVMAAWFREKGISEERLIVEDGALTTGDNARNVCALLTVRHPQIRELLLVTSDYHMQMGWLLFSAEASLYAYENGRLPYTLAGSAACIPPKGSAEYEQPKVQAQYLWSLLDPWY